MLGRLAVHHSGAIIEAGEYGLADVLGLGFEPALQALSSVLTCCEMTAGVERAGAVEPLPFGINNFSIF